MSLAEEANRVNVPPAWEPQSEFDGNTGHLITGPLERPVEDFAELLRRFDYDPEKVEVVGKVSQWRKEQKDGRWLTSYFFGIRSKAFTIDLPALYADVAKTKHRPLKVTPRDVTLVVCWADIQTGKVDRLGGMPELLLRLEEKRQALEAHIRKVKPSHIVIADVGDIVEGIENTSSQIATNGLALTDQIDVAATELWKTIRLCTQFAPVDVLAIPSNHAQLRRGKGLIGKPTDDWGLHINKRLEHLASEIGLPATFHRPADWEETLVFDIRGTRLGLAHGHQAANPNGVINWWTKLNHAGVLNCDVLLTGHFHFASVRPSGRNPLTGRSGWHIQASTLDNGSAWVRNQMGEDGDPALIVFELDDGGFALQGLAAL